MEGWGWIWWWDNGDSQGEGDCRLPIPARGPRTMPILWPWCGCAPRKVKLKTNVNTAAGQWSSLCSQKMLFLQPRGGCSTLDPPPATLTPHVPGRPVAGRKTSSSSFPQSICEIHNLSAFLPCDKAEKYNAFFFLSALSKRRRGRGRLGKICFNLQIFRSHMLVIMLPAACLQKPRAIQRIVPHVQTQDICSNGILRDLTLQ